MSKTIRISDEAHHAAKVGAAKDKMNLSDWIAKAIMNLSGKAKSKR